MKVVNNNQKEEYKALLVSSRVFMDNRQFYIKEFDNTYYYNFKAEYRFFKFNWNTFLENSFWRSDKFSVSCCYCKNKETRCYEYRNVQYGRNSYGY